MDKDLGVKRLKANPEDVEDILKTVEISYNIQFESNELAHLSTFGEMTDHIISKISLENKTDCTTQQLFY